MKKLEALFQEALKSNENFIVEVSESDFLEVINALKIKSNIDDLSYLKLQSMAYTFYILKMKPSRETIKRDVNLTI